mmetsp:Transcript_71995/g.161621  ORF Transcript_71995/g.161621 Transcript_71995/m.161621 type:complete len:427 (+) Transcript_71995:1244-2524(+)
MGCPADFLHCGRRCPEGLARMATPAPVRWAASLALAPEALWPLPTPGFSWTSPASAVRACTSPLSASSRRGVGGANVGSSVGGPTVGTLSTLALSPSPGSASWSPLTPAGMSPTTSSPTALSATATMPLAATSLLWGSAQNSTKGKLGEATRADHGGNASSCEAPPLGVSKDSSHASVSCQGKGPTTNGASPSLNGHTAVLGVRSTPSPPGGCLIGLTTPSAAASSCFLRNSCADGEIISRRRGDLWRATVCPAMATSVRIPEVATLVTEAERATPRGEACGVPAARAEAEATAETTLWCTRSAWSAFRMRLGSRSSCATASLMSAKESRVSYQLLWSVSTMASNSAESMPMEAPAACTRRPTSLPPLASSTGSGCSRPTPSAVPRGCAETRCAEAHEPGAGGQASSCRSRMLSPALRRRCRPRRT